MEDIEIKTKILEEIVQLHKNAPPDTKRFMNDIYEVYTFFKKGLPEATKPEVHKLN